MNEVLSERGWVSSLCNMTEILGEDTEALGEGVASVAVKITPIADAKAVECLPMTMAGMLES